MSTVRATLLDSESMAQEHPLTFTPSRLHRVEGIARTLMKGLRGTRLPACRNTSKSREQGYIGLESIKCGGKPDENLHRHPQGGCTGWKA